MPSDAVALLAMNLTGWSCCFRWSTVKREIPCAISTSAMDGLEGLARSKPNEREAQFMRLRDRIEDRSACKYAALEFEGTPPGVPGDSAGPTHSAISHLTKNT
jgi:hypothetical protein